MKPVWPLGTKFIDYKKRTFEVCHVTMGDPSATNAGISYVVEMHNGWKVTARPGDHPQTLVGFCEVSDTDKSNVITRTVEKMEEYIKNGQIKRI